jgi:DNA primase catalytic subunit
VEDSLRSLGREERRILVEYIKGTGFSPEHFYRLTHRHRKRIPPPRTVDGEIPARIARTYLRYGGASDREAISS